jgi:hypothetical protein
MWYFWILTKAFERLCLVSPLKICSIFGSRQILGMPSLSHPITNKAYVEFRGYGDSSYILAMHILPSQTMDLEELIIQSNQDVHVWFDMVAKMMGNK